MDKIVTGDVLSVLKPHSNEKPETASRLRGRIERITRGHYAAMHYGDVPTFMTRLRSKHSTAALALEFVVLTAARCGEAVERVGRKLILKMRCGRCRSHV